MQRTLDGSVVVVTGASSGVGRATAAAFSRHSARLVLVARDAVALDEVAVECAAAGAADVATVTADVGDAADIDRVTELALERFGRIDTWANVAAVLIAGDIGAVPLDELDRLVATNVRGMVLGSRAALGVFRTQGEGVLVNVSSVLGVVPNPVVPLYTMSKFAVRGLTLALQHAELPRAVRCCVVLPGPIDTPMFRRAANHVGAALRAVPPAAAPERVAAAIVGCARRPRRQVVVGATARLVMAGVRVAPALTELLVARISARLLVQHRVTALPTSGDLFATGGRRAIGGGWRWGGVRRRLGAAFGRAAADRGRS